MNAEEKLKEFQEESDRVDKEKAEKEAEQLIATREWLLDHIKRTRKLVVGGRTLEIRERLSAKEQDNFPNFFDLLEHTKSKDKADDSIIKEETSAFLAYIILDPKLKPEDINTCFNSVQKKRIINTFVQSIVLDKEVGELQSFRSVGLRPGDAGDGKDNRKDAK